MTKGGMSGTRTPQLINTGKTYIPTHLLSARDKSILSIIYLHFFTHIKVCGKVAPLAPPIAGGVIA